MSIANNATTTAKRPQRYTTNRPDVVVDGVTWTVRNRFAHDELHVGDHTLARAGVETIFIGGVAHVRRDTAAAEYIAAAAKRRKEQPKKRGRAR